MRGRSVFANFADSGFLFPHRMQLLTLPTNLWWHLRSPPATTIVRTGSRANDHGAYRPATTRCQRSFDCRSHSGADFPSIILCSDCRRTVWYPWDRAFGIGIKSIPRDRWNSLWDYWLGARYPCFLEHSRSTTINLLGLPMSQLHYASCPHCQGMFEYISSDANRLVECPRCRMRCMAPPVMQQFHDIANRSESVPNETTSQMQTELVVRQALFDQDRVPFTTRVQVVRTALFDDKQELFKLFHPMGECHDIVVNEVTSFHPIQRTQPLTVVRYTLKWSSLLVSDGWTHAELWLDPQTESVVDHMFVGTNGKTHQDVTAYQHAGWQIAGSLLLAMLFPSNE